MKNLAKFTLSVLLMLLVGCATTSSVSYNFDEKIDFDQYKTFVLCVDDFQIDNLDFPDYDNDLIRQYIGDEIESQMLLRGHKTNVLRPELQAGFQLLVENKEAVFLNCEVDSEYNYWKTYEEEFIPYTEQTLVLYVSDMTKNQVIWQASIVCDFNRSDKKLLEYAKNLTEKMFNTYPRSK